MTKLAARLLTRDPDGRPGMDKQEEREAVVRPRISRSAALMVLLTSGLAVLLVRCGGSGSTSTQTPLLPSAVAACGSGTVASFIGTTCSQSASLGTTFYHFSSYSCTSTPASICTSLGPNGSNLMIQMDPLGPYTLLVGRTSLWNVTAGQSVDVVISGTLYGGTGNANWPHFNAMKGAPVPLVGQTGDGTEENITTVGCAASGSCLDSKNGVSDVLCSSTSPRANCTDQQSIGPYLPYRANFKAATSSNPYTLTIEIKLNGGNSGTATLFSVGTHLGFPAM